MTISYEWKIEQIKLYPEIDKFKDVVFEVYWRINATDGQNTSTVYGSIIIELNKDNKFIPYDQLTEEQVINWTKNSIGNDDIDKYYEILNNDINVKINPITLIKNPPWEENKATDQE